MQRLRGWITPEEGARDFINLIDERLPSSRLSLRHYDFLQSFAD